MTPDALLHTRVCTAITTSARMKPLSKQPVENQGSEHCLRGWAYTETQTPDNPERTITFLGADTSSSVSLNRFGLSAIRPRSPHAKFEFGTNTDDNNGTYNSGIEKIPSETTDGDY